jgi:hypothetical protein
VSDLVAPAMKLGVQIIDVAKRSGGEKRRSKVLNLSFDSSLVQSSRMQVIGLVRIRLVFGSRILFIRSAASRFGSS